MPLVERNTVNRDHEICNLLPYKGNASECFQVLFSCSITRYQIAVITELVLILGSFVGHVLPTKAIVFS